MVARNSSVTATEAARRLSDLLNRVHYRGESFAIIRNGEEVARLTPPSAPDAGVPLGSLLARLDAARTGDAGFADDLEALQANQPPPGGTPWGS